MDWRSLKPTTRPAANNSVAAHRYGVVLVLLLLTFLFLVCGFTGAWIHPVTVTLQGATLLAALQAAEAPPRLQRIARVVVAVSVIVALLTIGESHDGAEIQGALLSALLISCAPVAIATSIVRRRVIDARTVLGAICIYVLIGLVWAFAFGLIGAIQHGPFFAQTAAKNSSDYVYFSFVTLTTTGYGDLTATSTVGRGIAVLEALLGQIYLVTVVALLVSNLRPRRPAAAVSEPDQAVPTDSGRPSTAAAHGSSSSETPRR